LYARFERSLILASPADGALLSVVRHDLADGPFTARLAPGGPADLRALEGDAPDGAPDGEGDGEGDDRRVDVDAHRAATWRPERVGPGDAAPDGEVARRIRQLDAAARRAGAGAAGIHAVASLHELEGLSTALAARDPSDAAEIAGRLAGLGPGLTPSGDDLLSGILAFAAWAEEAAILPSTAEIRAAVRDAAAPRTTRFAAQMLGAAARGHVFEPLARLLRTLLRRDASGLPDIAPLLAVGETSGGDMLTGVILGGRALLTGRRAAA
jgi:hypothetical protein